MSHIRLFSILLSTLIYGCQSSANKEGVDQKSERPNIIVIMVDDMGFSDISSYGGEIEMPNLNKLSSNGLKFTQFYNAGRCCPSRASLLTGQYAHKTGLGYMASQDMKKPGYRADLSLNSLTIAEVLKEAGYGTYMAGKWHLNLDFSEDGSNHNWPLQRGFDKFFGTLIGVGSYWNPITLVEGNKYIKPDSGFYYTEKITEKAVSYINGHDKNSPFFLYMAYTAPHFPLHARESAIAKHRGKFSSGWDSLREERYKRMVDMGLMDSKWKLANRDEHSVAWVDAEDKEWETTRMEAYAGTLSHVDDGIGEIIRTLQDRDQLENTLILFLSDNGGDFTSHRDGKINSTGMPWGRMIYVPLRTKGGIPVVAGDVPGVELGPENTYGSYGLKWANLSNTPFRKFKMYAHEGGISTPFIVHWPAAISDKNSWRKKTAHIIDIMATCLEVAGADYPGDYKGRKTNDLDGKSLLPIFENDKEIHKDGLFWEHQGNRGARVGKWKIVSSFIDGGEWELFNMEEDRTETVNLATSHPDIVRRLEKSYSDWAKRTNVEPWEELSIDSNLPAGNPLIRSGKELLEVQKIFDNAMDSLKRLKQESDYN